jgi:feruloyl esterase
MATSSVGYYEGVVNLTGGHKATEDFFRLFPVPGVHHGGGGPGFTEFDSFTALEDWVEKGIAPDRLIASRMSNGAVERATAQKWADLAGEIGTHMSARLR